MNSDYEILKRLRLAILLWDSPGWAPDKKLQADALAYTLEAVTAMRDRLALTEE